jgi:hypothetical protein
VIAILKGKVSFMAVLHPPSGQKITVLPATASDLGYLGNIGGLDPILWPRVPR